MYTYIILLCSIVMTNDPLKNNNGLFILLASRKKSKLSRTGIVNKYKINNCLKHIIKIIVIGCISIKVNNHKCYGRVELFLLNFNLPYNIFL